MAESSDFDRMTENRMTRDRSRWPRLIDLGTMAIHRRLAEARSKVLRDAGFDVYYAEDFHPAPAPMA
jgi:hypothetical protein